MIVFTILGVLLTLATIIIGGIMLYLILQDELNDRLKSSQNRGDLIILRNQIDKRLALSDD